MSNVIKNVAQTYITEVVLREAIEPSVIKMDSNGKSGMLWGKKISPFDNKGVSMNHSWGELQIFADMNKMKIKRGLSRIMPSNSGTELSKKDFVNAIKKDYPQVKDNQIGNATSDRGIKYYPLNKISMN